MVYQKEEINCGRVNHSITLKISPVPKEKETNRLHCGKRDMETDSYTLYQFLTDYVPIGTIKSLKKHLDTI